MTPEDINNALADEEIKAKLQDLLNKVLPEEAPKLEVVNIKVTFLENNRLQTQVQLQQKSEDSELPDQLKILVETGIKVNQGKSLELIDPTASLNDRKTSSRILKSVIGSVSDRLDLSRFENQGIIARLLKLEINPQEINIAAFIRLNPVNPL
jgi:pimeloyl-CoA synthetase